MKKKMDAVVRAVPYSICDVLYYGISAIIIVVAAINTIIIIYYEHIWSFCHGVLDAFLAKAAWCGGW